MRFLAQAESELDDVVSYYEAQSAGLGIKFAEAVRAGIARSSEHPNAWQSIGRRVRR